MTDDIRFTGKQLEILMVIKQGNDDGTPCSVYDILEHISYECKRDAMLHSLKILVEKGFVERRDLVKRAGKTVRVFSITTRALVFI
jgi:DNA-binding MarR family transcriptional regulator